MALITCEECKKEISDTAGKCPQCGAKIDKPMRLGSMILAAFVTVAVVQCSLSTNGSSPSKTTQAPPDPVAEARFQKTAMFAAGVKSKMRDPSSFALESARSNEDATVICLEYRARNGFGGMNKEFIVGTTKKVSQDAVAWNKHCTKPLIDMKHIEYALK